MYMHLKCIKTFLIVITVHCTRLSYYTVLDLLLKYLVMIEVLVLLSASYYDLILNWKETGEKQ